ncbi:MAG: SMC-Scp complex subunit ScpB [Planctomycetes bacterium]|nr:SMC-Scp complex subunit ScpB [Planctomycetota bacterium]
MARRKKNEIEDQAAEELEVMEEADEETADESESGEAVEQDSVEEQDDSEDESQDDTESDEDEDSSDGEDEDSDSDNEDDNDDSSGDADDEGDADSEDDAEGDEDGDDAEEEEPAVEMPLVNVVEAVLFAARQPLKLKQIAKYCGRRIRLDAVTEAIGELNRIYEESGRAFEIVEVAEQYQLMSRPEYVVYLKRMFGTVKKEVEKDKKLSPASLDTLSIIAYKQPIMRADVESIRGVGCGPVLRALIERGTVKVVGKAMDAVGQPLLYGTTEEFLKEFGLGALDELPMVHELRKATGTTSALPSGEEEHNPQLTLLCNDDDEDEGDEFEDDDLDDEDDEDDEDDDE